MHFLHRHFSGDLRRIRLRHQVRSLYDAAFSIERPRDRGLDHAVAREGHLRPLLNLKNLIIPHPSHSIPYSQIMQSKQTLEIPMRPLDFIRSYPTVFDEISPGSVGIQPDIKLTPEVIALHSEEDLIYHSVNYKQELANRLLKLLMISRVNKIPISLLERLKWDLGLPGDYEEALVPEFPDYFRVVRGKSTGEKELELVFWSDEFAVSDIEKGAKDGEVMFPLYYSAGFKIDKEYKKWLDEWQKLPYVSPYENAASLPVNSDESDRWAVGMLHEVLNLFIGKKAERESLICLGEYLGLKSRFKLAFLQHPGIFYCSTKIGTKTIVLRDGYRRGALFKRHALVDLRYKYCQLMDKKVEEEKTNEKGDKKSGTNVKKDVVERDEDSESQEEDGDVMVASSEDDDEEEDDDDDSEDEDESENEVQRVRPNGRRIQESERGNSIGFSRTGGYVPRRSNQNLDDFGEGEGNRENNRRGTFNRGSQRFEEKNVRSMERRSTGRSGRENGYESSTRFSRRNDARSDGNARRNPEKISDYYVEGVGRSANKMIRPKRNFDKFGEKNVGRRSNDENGRESSTKRNFDKFGEKNVRRNVRRMSNDENVSESSTELSRRNNVRSEPDDENENESSPMLSKRNNVRGEPNVSTRSTGRSNLPRVSAKLRKAKFFS